MTSRDYLNVTFIFAGDERTLYDNSDVLASISPYFKTLFSSNFKERSFMETRKTGLPETEQARRRPFVDSDDEADPRAPPHRPHAPSSDYRIEITETSFNTYLAVLIWIHTNQISFAPLTSGGTRDVPVAPTTSHHSPTSPKSVYRLADFLELHELKSLALSSILSQVKATNAIEELMSDVSTLYEPIKAALLDFTAQNWNEVKKSEDWKDLEAKVRAGDQDIPESTMWICVALLGMLRG